MQRQIKSRVIIASSAAILLSACTGGTTVELVNRASQPLVNVSVEFTGGSTAPQPIQPGHDATVRFNPTGESSLTVLYQSSKGPQTCKVDTYLESGYRAKFEIDLHEDFCTIIRDEVKLPSLIGAVLSNPSPN